MVKRQKPFLNSRLKFHPLKLFDLDDICITLVSDFFNDSSKGRRPYLYCQAKPHMMVDGLFLRKPL